MKKTKVKSSDWARAVESVKSLNVALEKVREMVRKLSQEEQVKFYFGR